MILMKFLKRYKYIRPMLYIIVMLIFASFSIKSDTIVSNAITCIAIIFAFSQSFLLATYANKDINLYMKRKGMFDKFIKDNRNFIYSSIISLFFLFPLNACPFNYYFLNFVHFSSSHIALFIVIIELIQTFLFATSYMNVYKNSYSDKVIGQK